MRAVCKKDELIKVLEIAVRMSTRTHTLPVLQCVRIEVTDNTLEIRSTNLEMGCIGKVTATQTEPGVVAVLAQTLLQTVHLSTATTVTMSTSGDVLVLESARGRFDLKTQTTDDFPTITHISKSTGTIEGNLFSNGIKSVVFAASQSSIKPELGAVYVYQKKPHTLTFVATDSFRLAERTIPSKFSLEKSLLIPNRNALEVARTIDLLNESPEVSVIDNQIAFMFPSGMYLTSRLIEGNFPDYEQIIPKEYQTYTTLLCTDLERALRATTIFSNKFMQVLFAVQPETSTVTLRSENSEYGKAEEVIHGTGHGAELRVSFNQHYLAEPLSHFPGDSIECALAGIGRPMVMTSPNTTDFRYLVMPMNK
jgi:DNA polymerase III subunit beta